MGGHQKDGFGLHRGQSCLSVIGSEPEQREWLERGGQLPNELSLSGLSTSGSYFRFAQSGPILWWMENGERLARLTEREKVCLRQWLQHKSAKEIAVDLSISHHAVEKRLKMARAKLGAASSLEAARLLSEAEGYGQTVAQSPDLSPHALPVQKGFKRPLIFGAIIMTLIGAVVLALVMQPIAETSPLAETDLLAREYDEQLNLVLMAMIGSAVIDPTGEIVLTYPLGDQRFLEPNSGHYWQISVSAVWTPPCAVG